MKFFIIILIFNAALTANAALKNNYQILDSMMSSSAKIMCSKLKQNSIDSFSYSVMNHSASWLYDKHLPYFAALDSLTLRDSSENVMIIYIDEASCEYEYLDSQNDSLRRYIVFQFTSILDANGQKKPLLKDKYIYTDVITESDIAAIHDYPYAIAKGVIPDKELSLYTKYFEPIIITSAAVLTIVLLFTLRSK